MNHGLSSQENEQVFSEPMNLFRIKTNLKSTNYESVVIHKAHPF